MYQSNLIIVKNEKAVSYLQGMEYNVVPMELLGGWKACCSYEKCYLDQVIGSKASTLAEYGKYPYELSAADYPRAIQKENDFFDLVLLRQKEDDFAEKVKQIRDMSVRSAELSMEIRLWDSQKNSVEEENELRKKKEEMLMLDALLAEFRKDKVLMYAFCYEEEKIRKEKYQHMDRWNFWLQNYLYYHRLFSRLLRYQPYIFLTYANDELPKEERKKEFKLVKTIRFENLRIGDLALLCNKDVLKIYRGKQ